MNMRSAVFVCGLFVLFFSVGSTVSAQSFGLGGQSPFIPSFGQVAPGVGGLFTTLSLIATPHYPDPHSQFEVELSAPDQKYAGAVIKWYVNGVEDISARNKRLHSLTAGDLGEKMTIRVTLEKQSGGVEEVMMVVVPTRMDIVIESDTTVPSFYAGRALPSRGSHARATAVLFTGSAIDRDTLTYDWELNSTPLAAGPIRGLSTVNFDMPLGNVSYLNVAVSNSQGVIAEKSIELRPANPQILFYEENPLLGIKPRALVDQVSLVGNQITVRAEPYYLSAFKGNPHFLAEWSLAGQRFDNSGAEEPNVVTLRSDGSTSEGNIGLRMADLSSLLPPVSNSFYLKFGF